MTEPSHAPEVLADLVQRLRRARPQPEPAPTFSELVHELPRDEVAAACGWSVWELDLPATRALNGGRYPGDE